jgi:methionyl-tRNA formyltransferase
MRVTAGLDSGPVCAQAREPIAATDTYGTLAERLMVLGGQLLVASLDDQPPFHDQDDALATYADKVSAEDRVLDPQRPAAELERVVRALAPHVGAALHLDDGTRLGIWEARADTGSGPPPGELDTGGSAPVLGCGEGSLELLVVQPPGRRAMAGADYLRGRRS